MKRKLIASLIAVTALVSSSVLAGVNPHIVKVDMDIEGVADAAEFGTALEPGGPGGFVAKGGWKMIKLSVDGAGSARLNWNSTNIVVCTQDGTALANPTCWPDTATMPTNLWVYGVDASASGPSALPGETALKICGPEHITLEALNNGTPYATPYFDRVGFTVVKLGWTPDFDRDGKIDDADQLRLTAKGGFRFWINDDRDDGFWGIHAQEDSPQGSYLAIDASSWYLPWTWIGTHVGNRSINCGDAKINGIRDMVDFFPVALDLPTNLFGTAEYKYVLVHGGDAVNYAYTPLTPSTASEFFQATNQIHYGKGRDKSADEVPVTKVNGTGVILDAAWLSSSTGLAPVLVMEGRAESLDQDLTIKIIRKSDNVEIAAWSRGLYISPVSNMFRYLNIRTNDTFWSNHTKPSGPGVTSRASKEGTWATKLTDPENNPDGFYMNDGDTQKTIVFVHGLDWDHDETPAGHAEVFKRLFQSGSNARYIGVSWASDMSRRFPGQPLAYGSDVIGAFVAARIVKDALTTGGFTGPDTTVIAHSLGNVLISSAIEDHNLDAGKYVMLNPAVPLESYDWRASITNKMAMTHPYWKEPGNVYAERVTCAGWGGLFSAVDPRSRLTWDGRFANVMTKTTAYQFYSTGEEILKQPNGIIPDKGLLQYVLCLCVNRLPFIPDVPLPEEALASGEYVWVYNEMSKGQPSLLDTLPVSNHANAGWKFNEDWDVGYPYWDANGVQQIYYDTMPAVQANPLTTTQLIANPFFDKFKASADLDITNWVTAASTLYVNDTANTNLPLTLESATMDQIKCHAKLLGEAIPPLSGPAGSLAVKAILDETRAFNMMDSAFRDTIAWPVVRKGKANDQQTKQRWLHGDYKAAPYLLTYRLYKKFVEIAE
jgi:hypothetical protein